MGGQTSRSTGSFEILLYDLTGTYFESLAADDPLVGRGYSRDHRPYRGG